MSDEPPSDEMLFEVLTPLDFRVRVTRSYWKLIVSDKHPAMRGREADVRDASNIPNKSG